MIKPCLTCHPFACDSYWSVGPETWARRMRSRITCEERTASSGTPSADSRNSRKAIFLLSWDSDLSKMQRATVTLADPTIGTMHTYQ